MAVSTTTLESIKRAPISTVMEASGANLKRVGREYITQCVWHEDTNPSLTVNDDKNFCFCHVCRKGGDAIDYISAKQGLGFRDAAEFAASVLNVNFELDDEDPEEARKRAAVRRSAISELEAKQETFMANMRHEKAGRIRKFWKDRGLTKDAANEFGIGFSPKGEFASRITIPIFNHKNELVGFTGRTTIDQPGKYKNSADSALFQKKELVFNEVRAKQAARESGSLIFVEGHLDVVSMWQAGIKNVVAMQGTGAPDKMTLKRLAKASKNFILCFDGDAGGEKAVQQFISVAGHLALAGEVAINVVTLPEGSDPDEVIRSGEDLYSYIANAPSWLDWLIDVWAAKLDMSNTSEVMDVEEKLRNLINGLRSDALRTHYIGRAAQVLSQNAKEAEKLAKDWNTDERMVAELEWHKRDPLSVRRAVETRLVRMYIHRPELRPRLAKYMGRVQHPPLKWLCERLRELKKLCTVDLTPHSVAAIVCVAEPHFMTQLRSLVQPKVNIDDSEDVIEHLDGILAETVDFVPDESDTDQPSA